MPSFLCTRSLENAAYRDMLDHGRMFYVIRLTFFEVARAAFLSNISPMQVVRSSVRRANLLTMVNV